MCPNRQIISLYHDGELPSPWREKMETHLEVCPECRAVLTGYGRIGESLREQDREILDAAQERVWKKLIAPEIISGPRTAGPLVRDLPASLRRGAVSLRYRRVTLPLPAVAAAILLIIASFALVGIRSITRSPSQDSVATATIGLDEQGILPIQDITEVLQYLSSQDNGDFMVIRLPESRKFSRFGEPALINAADYSRRNIFP